MTLDEASTEYGDFMDDSAAAPDSEPNPEKPEAGWFFVEEWSPTHRIGSPTEDDIEVILKEKRAPVDKEASMLPAWRQSFLKKLEAKAAEDEFNDGYKPYNWADHLAKADAPSGLMATALTPLGEQIWRKDTRTTAQKKAEDLRRVFDRIDKDKDGKLSAQDIARTMKSLGQKGVKLSDTKNIVFESDDDGDGKVGWEEFSNLWVRLKRPLSLEHAGMPMSLFNLMDFLHMDIVFGKDSGAINSNKLLQLFHYRYQKIAALEVMDDVSVGETGEAGVPYPVFVQRDEKLRKVMFTNNRYGALMKEDLAELHVSTHPTQGCSGTLRRVRPPTPTTIPYAQVLNKGSATDRKKKPALAFSYDQLFEGQRHANRSPGRQRSFYRGQMETVERERLDKLGLDSFGASSRSRSRPGTPASARKSKSAGSMRRTKSASQMSKIPKMSERLRESRHGPRETGARVEVSLHS